MDRSCRLISVEKNLLNQWNKLPLELMCVHGACVSGGEPG